MAFHNTRENESGLDLKREIDGDKVELVAGVKIFLRDRRFDFVIAFHEDREVLFLRGQARLKMVWSSDYRPSARCDTDRRGSWRER